MGWEETFRYRDCPWCGATSAQMQSLTNINVASTAADSTQRFWTLLGCPRCAGAITIEYTPPNTPNRVLRQIPESAFVSLRVGHLPEKVAGHYRDAIIVLQAGVPDAAAVQLRKTLESAAAEFDVQPYPLVKAIKTLIEKGLITTNFGEVLDHIRVLGNSGAHASDERVEAEGAESALQFTTQVLRNLFEIPAELKRITNPEESTA